MPIDSYKDIYMLTSKASNRFHLFYKTDIQTQNNYIICKGPIEGGNLIKLHFLRTDVSKNVLSAVSTNMSTHTHHYAHKYACNTYSHIVPLLKTKESYKIVRVSERAFSGITG